MFLRQARYIYSDYRPCDACSSTSFERIATVLSPRIIGVQARIVICQDCGLITTNPRPNKESYFKINRIWYRQKYHYRPPTWNPETRFHNWELMWKRISEYYPNGPNSVLDVGAGSGGAIEFLKSLYPSIKVMAIEQSQIFREYIANKIGVPVLNTDIDSHWPDDLYGRFDLIIFRHTLEHLLNPFSALKQASDCLTPGGHVYLVVPNAMQLPPGCGVRTGYFIPVHINYFNMATLTRICGRAGLTPTVIKAEKEIWGLFEIEKEGVKRSQFFENSYHAQKEKILREIRSRTFYDMKEISKIIAKNILPDRDLEILKWFQRINLFNLRKK